MNLFLLQKIISVLNIIPSDFNGVILNI